MQNKRLKVKSAKTSRKDKLHCIKNKGGSTNLLHTFCITLFSRVGTSSVLEFL